MLVCISRRRLGEGGQKCTNRAWEGHWTMEGRLDDWREHHGENPMPFAEDAFTEYGLRAGAVMMG